MSVLISNEKLRQQVAGNLREFVKKHKLSQRKMEESVQLRGNSDGLSRRQMANIMDEKSSPSVEALQDMGRPFGVPAWQMMLPGRADSSASPSKLEKVAIAYLRGDDDFRSVMDRLADTVLKP